MLFFSLFFFFCCCCCCCGGSKRDGKKKPTNIRKRRIGNKRISIKKTHPTIKKKKRKKTSIKTQPKKNTRNHQRNKKNKNKRRRITIKENRGDHFVCWEGGGIFDHSFGGEELLDMGEKVKEVDEEVCGQDGAKDVELCFGVV